MEINLIIAIVFVLIFIAGGIYSIYRYKETRDKKWLIIGLALTAVVIGLLLYITLYDAMTATVYAPPEQMN